MLGAISHASKHPPDFTLRRSFTRPSTALAVTEGLGTRLSILLSSVVFFPDPPKKSKSGNGVLGGVSCHMGQAQKILLGQPETSHKTRFFCFLQFGSRYDCLHNSTIIALRVELLNCDIGLTDLSQDKGHQFFGLPVT